MLHMWQVATTITGELVMKKIVGCVFVAMLSLACAKDDPDKRHIASDSGVRGSSAQVLDVPVVQTPKPVTADTEVTAVITLSKPADTARAVDTPEAFVPQVDAKAIHSWADYSTAKTGMWARFSQRNDATWAQFMKEKDRLWSQYHSVETKARTIFREADRKNYLEWLDAYDQNDLNLQQRIEGVVPAARAYAQATAGVYKTLMTEGVKQAELRRDALLKQIEDVLKKEEAALDKAAKTFK